MPYPFLLLALPPTIEVEHVHLSEADQGASPSFTSETQAKTQAASVLATDTLSQPVPIELPKTRLPDHSTSLPPDAVLPIRSVEPLATDDGSTTFATSATALDSPHNGNPAFTEVASPVTATDVIVPNIYALPLAQSSPPELSQPESPVEEPPPETRDAPANPTVPNAVSPEPFWSNGAVTGEGELLPPSQPTDRPDIPLDLTADYQEYAPLRQMVTARGNVVLQLGSGLLKADRLWVNLFNRYVLAEGNVVFQQGDQTIRAERGEYNLLQGQGSLFQARGTVFLPGLGADFGEILPRDADSNRRPISDRLREDPLDDVRGTGGITLATDGNEDLDNATSDTVRRVRFEAAQVDFNAEGWVAYDVRLTNDPFSPPELELRGDTATFTRLNDQQDQLVIERPGLVFDQSFRLPLFRSTFVFDRGSDGVNPFSVAIGYDGDDRDGLFLERTFRVARIPPWDLRLTPQLLVQSLANNSEFNNLRNYGLVAELDGQFGPTTQVRTRASFSGLDLGDNLDERLRASARVEQALGNHRLNLEYSYRDRLFNGSLGFQDIQSSVGAVLLSPDIVLGDTKIRLNYQVGAQYVTAETDLPEFLDPFEDKELISLGRFQGSLSLTRGFTLWRGTPLPPTRDEGLRFTPRPVVPNLRLVLNSRGTYTYYTNEDVQESVTASVGIRGTVGHFSRDYLDSTVFNLAYRRSFVGDGESPFLFDRDIDRNVLFGGIIQQIYGPFRVGVQVSYNLDTREFFDTDYILEYSRRTYGIVVRFDPNQASGFIGFRLSEFDWSGQAAQFGGADLRQVESGVVR
ncbi:MAG: DUF3769 domain-containing protein [Cyanobacteria bacterium J06638_28]